MTRKELIDGGWVDKYLLGLTSEEESHEVERLASLYPEIQEEINRSRQKICGKFNRSLTQPAMRHSFATKRRILYGSGVTLLMVLAGFAFVCKKHFSLQRDFHQQGQLLAEEEARLNQWVSYSKSTSEQSAFLHANSTRKIRLRGCGNDPEAEVMVFQCGISGKMKLRVIDLPQLPDGQYYQVWAEQPGQDNRLLGALYPPLRYDSLYALDSALCCTALRINAIDPLTHASEAVCLASVMQ